MKDQIKNFITKSEPYFFYLILLISLIPILTPYVFHTLDGASHLHNAKIITELLKNNDFFKQFYSFNPILVPNLTGHYILAFLLLIFPVSITIKIFLTLYYFLFCFSFRKMVKSLNGNMVMSYFIFPMGYSFFLLLGFFNFIIGFVFVFFGISILFRESYNKKKLSFWIELFIWTHLIWFSHPILFLFWLIILSIFLLQNMFFDNNRDYKFNIPYMLMIKLFIIVLPAFVLSLLYLYGYNGNEIKIYTPFIEKLVYIFNFRTLLLFNIPQEKFYSIPFSLLLFILFTISYIRIFLKYRSIKNYTLFQAMLFGMANITLLFLYFYLPNEMGNGGYITDRLNFIFFIFLIITLVKFPINSRLLFISAGIVLFLYIQHLNYLYQPFKTISHQAELLTKATKLVDKNKTIVAINRSPEWFDGHITNYIGIDNSIYIQENYEADKGYFPIVYNTNQMPELNVGLLTPYNSCIPMPKSAIHKVIVADYVLIIDILNSDNECDKSIIENLQQNYNLISNSDCKDFSLYKIK